MHSFSQFFQNNPYHWLTIIISSFILEDPTTLYVSTGVQLKKISFLYGYFSVVSGLCIGDLGIYMLGKSGKFIGKNKLGNISGLWIFLVRFFPGLRVPIYGLSGYSNYSIWKFILINLISSAIWVLILFQGGRSLFHSYGWKGIGLAAALLILSAQAFKLYKKINDKKNPPAS